MFSGSHRDPKREALRRRPLYLPLAMPLLLGITFLVLIWWMVQAWGNTTSIFLMRCATAPDAAWRSAAASDPRGLLVTPAAMDASLPIARRLDLTVLQTPAVRLLESRDGGHWVACVAPADLSELEADLGSENARKGTSAWLVVVPALGRRSVTALDFSPR